MLKDYPCLYPHCKFLSVYYAKDNKAKYGHICVFHYKQLRSDDRDDYEYKMRLD